MIYTDRVYGRVKTEEPVVLELIKSPSLQRLKGIGQAGYSPLYFQLLSLKGSDFSRFEHSLGVFILLMKFGASSEEQIAGLIHDVSHTVFSHTADYIFDSGSPTNHDYQDKIHKDFVRNSEIPEILGKFGFDVDYILDETNFPLKEKPLPDLCADRLDYSLRNSVTYKVGSKKQVNYFLSHLTTINNLWVFKNFTSAQKYANLFYHLNTVHYAGFATAVMFQATADVLKYALEKKYVIKKDLFTTDQEVLRKIKKHLKVDPKLKLFYDRMAGKSKVKNNPQNYDVRTVLKSRIVDPLFKTNSKIKRLSQVEKNWAKIVSEESKPKEYFIWFER